MLGWKDEDLLTWAAEHDFVVVSRDVTTLKPAAYDRIVRGLYKPVVFLLRRRVRLQALVDEILTVDACSTAEEWEGQVVYVPLH